MNYVGAIDITDQERSILDHIAFDPDRFDHEVYLQNADAVPRLMESLVQRGAIPAHRLAYFTDHNYHSGRLKGSRLSIFERNGTSGRDIFKHPHFLNYLWYFLYGSRLPSDVIEEMKRLITRLDPISGGDTGEICDVARELFSRHRFDAEQFSDELFKLCLDCGVPLMWADHIRGVVRKMRLRKGG